MSRRSADGQHVNGTNGVNDTAPDRPPHSSANEKGHRHIPGFNHNGHKVTKGIQPEGESGRKGFHPLKFFTICMRSSSKVSGAVNVLWPFVPAAIAIYFIKRNHLHIDKSAPEEELHHQEQYAKHWSTVIFILAYIAMIPAANLIGFAGQELARKVPKVIGVVMETTLGSIVEIVLFMILISRPNPDNIRVIKAAILGSILANLLLCLGLCFFVGGLKREDQIFHEAVSEVGTGLMMVAGVALILPSVFASSLQGTEGQYEKEVNRISRGVAIMLIVAYLVYVWFQTRSHHGLYDDILEADEHKDADRQRDLAKEKLTFTECLIALAIALACVCLIALALVDQIETIVELGHVSDAFMGLILVPLVEKVAEHLTAIDEAWDNQMNFALSHVLGASIQTTLLNTPLVVFVGWGLGKSMNLQFEIFDSVTLILAIIVVGNFLRDGKSNYLEGFLCVLVYIIVALCAFYYPNPGQHGGQSGGTTGGEQSGGAETSAGGHERRFMF